ncbi:MAG: hypothetical protein JJE21_02830 [Spirochaetaceae bacterium]|nr:hypothetical protein [Spirochaetaceae bacterium]
MNLTSLTTNEAPTMDITNSVLFPLVEHCQSYKTGSTRVISVALLSTMVFSYSLNNDVEITLFSNSPNIIENTILSNETTAQYLNNDIHNFFDTKNSIILHEQESNNLAQNLDFSSLKFFHNNAELKEEIGVNRFNKIHQVIEDQLTFREDFIGLLPKIIENISKIKD